MSDPVDCPEHGPSSLEAFVCRHLAERTGPGWNTSGDPEQACPDAWCDDCERVRAAADGWDEPDIRLLCAHCYHRLRGERLAAPALDLSTAAAAVHSARHLLQERNDALRHWFTGGRWWYDLDDAYLEFRDDGRPRVRFRIVDVGSYNSARGSWMWGWANPSVPAPVAAPCAAVDGFLRAHHLAELAEPHGAMTLDDAWGRASLGAAVLGATGLYRCPAEPLHIFFALFDPAVPE